MYVRKTSLLEAIECYWVSTLFLVSCLAFVLELIFSDSASNIVFYMAFFGGMRSYFLSLKFSSPTWHIILIMISGVGVFYFEEGMQQIYSLVLVLDFFQMVLMFAFGKGIALVLEKLVFQEQRNNLADQMQHRGIYVQVPVLTVF